MFRDLHPDPRKAAALRSYCDLVRRWAPRTDLVSARDLARVEERHVTDSLRLSGLVDEAPDGPAADVGSGAGLPGIPLAICFPDRQWRLLEPRRKRAAFLEETVRVLGLDNVTVLPVTAEDAAEDDSLRHAHPLVVARALARPEEAIALLLPLVAAGGRAAILTADDAIPPNSTRWGPGIATVSHGPADGRK